MDPVSQGRKHAIAFYRCDECMMYHLTSKGYGDSSFTRDERVV